MKYLAAEVVLVLVAAILTLPHPHKEKHMDQFEELTDDEAKAVTGGMVAVCGDAIGCGAQSGNVSGNWDTGAITYNSPPPYYGGASGHY